MLRLILTKMLALLVAYNKARTALHFKITPPPIYAWFFQVVSRSKRWLLHFRFSNQIIFALTEVIRRATCPVHLNSTNLVSPLFSISTLIFPTLSSSRCLFLCFETSQQMYILFHNDYCFLFLTSSSACVCSCAFTTSDLYSHLLPVSNLRFEHNSGVSNNRLCASGKEINVSEYHQLMF